MIVLMEVSFEYLKFYEFFIKVIKCNDNIVLCYYLIGDFDFMIKIICVLLN